MKITLSWLKDHLETSASLDELVQGLIHLGHEVEDVDAPSQRLKDFVVARVTRREKHPDADRLSLCQVDDGVTTHQVVCGAPNVREGMLVAFCRLGVVVPSTGEALKKGSIRGVESCGMLCSARELLLGQDADGIMDLDTTAKPGTPLVEALGLSDAVIEISLTPNRSDCFSVRGLARDLAAMGMGKLKSLQAHSISTSSSALVRVETPACGHFMLRAIADVGSKEAPTWMRERLEACGQKSISALVDVTNYVCLDLGRPLHVFDAQKVQGNICVRLARTGETLDALDGQTYELDEEMIVIADESGPISLAGVMGGMSTAVDLFTTSVLLESAYFDAPGIARTGQKLKIQSESRTRFERGVDFNMVSHGLDVATAYILELCGGRVGGTSSVQTQTFEHAFITLKHEKIKRYLDLEIEAKRVQEILVSLGFEVSIKAANYEVKIPSWRHDVMLDVDLLEEIARIHGYHTIEAKSLPLVPVQITLSREDIARRVLSALGLYEILSWSMIPGATSALFGEGVTIQTPISGDMAVLRPSLVAGLLRGVKNNQDRSMMNVALFEIAHVYVMSSSLHTEERCMAGARSFHQADKHWHTSASVDVFSVKADLFTLIENMGIDPNKLQMERNAAPTYYHPGRSAALKMGNKTIAYFGEVHPLVQKHFELRGSAFVFELFTDRLPPFAQKKKNAMAQISPFQAMTRDVAFVMDRVLAVGPLVTTLMKVDPKLIQDVSVLDVYTGDKVAASQKSVALGFRIQALDRTLSEAEITELMQKIMKDAEKYGAVLRCDNAA